MPDPTTVATRTVNASPASAHAAVGVPSVVSDRPMAAGPSTSSDRASIGSGGTTDIHSMNRNGLSGCACRLDTLPNAHPSPPHSVSTTGSSPAEAPAPARRAAMPPSPQSASPTPTACRALIRSRSHAAPSRTVNGADACRTRDASPVGMPVSIAR